MATQILPTGSHLSGEMEWEAQGMAPLFKEIFQGPQKTLLFISPWTNIKWSELVSKGLEV